jgi:integrase
MAHDERPKLALVTEDRFASVVRAFMASPKFKGYAPATQDLWGRELRFASRPDTLGNLSVNEIRPSLVQAFFDGIDGRPGKQGAALAALKQLEKWAIVRDLLPRQITLGVEIEESDGGHIPWSDEHVALAERHARKDIARAVTLGANLGQRGSDLVRVGWPDIENYKGMDGVNVRQVKTGREVWVPITSPLAAAIATWKREPGPFLRRLNGLPWNRDALTNAWAYERDTNPKLAPLRACGPDKDRPLVMHGLRGHACVRLLRAGATTRQISDMVGMSEEMVANYTKFSVQRDNASAAVFHLERTLRERNLDKSNRTGS